MRCFIWVCWFDLKIVKAYNAAIGFQARPMPRAFLAFRRIPAEGGVRADVRPPASRGFGALALPRNQGDIMKPSRWLAALTVLLACMALLTAPADADARKHDSKGETQARKSADRKKQADDDRALWLERTRNNSEIMSGKASLYSKDLHNSNTASGYRYDMYTFTAAHRTLPMGTVVRVTDHSNGKSVMVCVTDRGPFVRGRIIDLSYAAARQINLNGRGVGNVDLEVVSDENGTPLNADQAYYVRYASGTGRQSIGPFRAFADAASMHEAMRQAHPEAEVVLDSARQ